MVAFWFGPTIPRYVMDRRPLIQPHPRTHQIICSNLKQNRHDITSGNKRRWTCYHQQRHVRREELANDVTQWNDDSASLRGFKLFFDILCCSKLGIRMEIKATEIGLFGPLTLTESPERVLQGNMFNQIWRIKGSIGRFIIFSNYNAKNNHSVLKLSNTNQKFQMRTWQKTTHCCLSQNSAPTKHRVLWTMRFCVRLRW